MKTTTVSVVLDDEATALERLFGNMRRRCVPVQAVMISRESSGLLVSLVMEQHLEPTAREMLARAPEVRAIVEPAGDTFWCQFD